MASRTKNQTFISISHFLLLILIFLNLNLNISGAKTPHLGTPATNTTFSSLELEAGLSEFSTWESVSTHRILQGKSNYFTPPALKTPPACNAQRYEVCVFANAKGVKGRVCRPYDKCRLGSHV